MPEYDGTTIVLFSDESWNLAEPGYVVKREGINILILSASLEEVYTSGDASSIMEKQTAASSRAAQRYMDQILAPHSFH